MQEWHRRVLAYGALAVLFAPLIVEALHKKPSNQQTEGTAERKHVAQQDKQGTQAPSSKAAPPKVHGDGSKRGADTKEGEHGAVYDFLVKFLELKLSDVLLAAFTGLLALYTRRLYVATHALAQADRPRMLVSELKVSGIRNAPDAKTGEVKVLLGYRLKNFGKSAASLTRFSMKIRLDTNVEPNPDYSDAVEAREIRHILPPNGWFGNSPKPYESSATPAEVADVLAKRKWIFFFGIIEYSGLGGTEHKLRFCYRVHFGNGNDSEVFEPTGPDSYWEET